MKSITQKALSLILTFAMLFGMVQSTGVVAFAADTGVTAYYCDSGLFKDSSYKVKINDNANDMKFRGTITKVEVKDGTSAIERSAFQNCNSLTSIAIPNSVKTIGMYAFYKCSHLTEFIVGDGSQYYVATDGVLFSKDTKTLVSYPAGRTGKYEIPVGVTEIAETAFKSCQGLSEITFPESLKKISDDAFGNCSQLTSLTFPNSEVSIGFIAFQFCSELKSVALPNGSTSLGSGAFWSCKKLTSVTLSGNAKIETDTFGNCSKLNNLYVVGDKAPNNLPYIPNVFLFKDKGETYEMTDYSGVKIDIEIPKELYGKKIDPEIDESKLQKTAVIAYYNGTGLYSDSNCKKEAQINNQYRSAITEIRFLDGVTAIGNIAFSGCENLTSITIPVSVTTIGSNAFSGCESLTSITIPKSVIFIGDDAFAGCVNLTAINVDASNSAFSSVDGVLYSKDITTLIQYPYKRSGKFAIPNTVIFIGDAAFGGCTGLTSITIPNSVSTIGDSAFSDCTGLTSITIPTSVSTIGDDAFSYCTGLTSVTISKSVTSIGHNVFNSCVSLNNFYYVGDAVPKEYPYFPNTFLFKDNGGSYEMTGYAGSKIGIKIPTELYGKKIDPAIDESKLQKTTVTAYYNGEKLYKDKSCTTAISTSDDYRRTITDIIFLDNVTTINSAFQRCSSLTSITIPQSVSSIAPGSFILCTGLTQFIVDPNNVDFTAFDGVLYSKDKKTLICFPAAKSREYTVSDDVTSIGEGAFYFCTNLINVTIPQSVSSIGIFAFGNCTGLNNVTFKGNSITSIGNGAFAKEQANSSLTFYVPSGKENDYKTLLNSDVMSSTTAVIKTIQNPDNGGSQHHNKDNPTSNTPAIPTTVTNTPTNTTADLSGIVLPSGVTGVNLNVTKKEPSNKSDKQAADFSRALLANPKSGIIGNPVVYNMELLDQNGSVTSGTGKIKISLPIPSGLRGTLHVLRFEQTGAFADMGAKVENGLLVFETDRLGYFAAAGVGESIMLDTTSYTMPMNGNYEIGLRVTGTRGTSVKVHSTNDRIAKVVQLKNGNYQVSGTGTGTAYIMYDVYDPKNRLLTHASVKITVQNGVKPNGNSVRQIGIY